MYHAAILFHPRPGWAQTILSDIVPGAHVMVEGTLADAIEGRRASLTVRDSLMILGPDITRTFFLFRKPVDAATVAANVMKHGAGGINTGACHIGDEARINHYCNPETTYSGGWGVETTATQTEALGRWPTNLVCLHTDDCAFNGKTQIRVNSAGLTNKYQDVKDKYKQTYSLGWSVRSTVHHGQDGWESVDEWRCGGACTVPTINQESPNADRFYPQVKDEAALLDWFRALIMPPETQILILRRPTL